MVQTCSQVVGVCFLRRDEGGKDMAWIALDFQEESHVSGINEILKRWLVRRQKLPSDQSSDNSPQLLFISSATETPPCRGSVSQAVNDMSTRDLPKGSAC